MRLMQIINVRNIMKRNKIYKKILIFLISIICLLLTSCGFNCNKDEVNNIKSNLYSSLTLNFNYYYSMDLFTFDQIIDDFIKGEEKSFLLGEINIVSLYSPTYIDSIKVLQENFDKTIITDNLRDSISQLIETKNKHLEFLKKKLSKNDLDFFNTTKYQELSDLFKEININILEIQNEDEYIEMINKAITLMKEIS